MGDPTTITGTDGADSPLAIVSPCRHLRSKGMYVYTDGNGGSSSDDGDDNSIYWCLHTMKSFGPDDQYVGGCECRDVGRSCHQPI